MTKQTKPRKKYLLFTALLAAVTTVYCNYSLEAETWTVQSRKLPAAFDGFRIALLTDLHGAEFGPENRQLLETVRQCRPDLIAISGDLADEDTSMEILPPLLQSLKDIAPVYFVTGNHEWVRADTEAVLAQIAACGVTVLRNGYVTMERNGQTLVLAGTEDPNGYADMETPAQLMARIRREQGQEAYVIMLYHRNDALTMWSELGPELLLCGHGHGGVIRLPGVGGLLGVDRRFFPKNCEGLYRERDTTMAVSRGLGGLRLWNPPHLPVIELRCAGK